MRLGRGRAGCERGGGGGGGRGRGARSSRQARTVSRRGSSPRGAARPGRAERGARPPPRRPGCRPQPRPLAALLLLPSVLLHCPPIHSLHPLTAPHPRPRPPHPRGKKEENPSVPMSQPTARPKMCQQLEHLCPVSYCLGICVLKSSWGELHIQAGSSAEHVCLKLVTPKPKGKGSLSSQFP